MRLKSHISHFINVLRGKLKAITDRFPRSNGQNNDAKKVTPRQRHAGGRPRKMISLPAVLQQIERGDSVAKIARGLQISESTVAARLKESNVAEPAQPSSHLPVQPALPLEARPMSPPSEPVTPSQPITEPVTNLDALARKGLKPDMRAFFLVNGGHNTEFGAGSEQFCVGIDAWHAEYWNLPLFRDAERIWVVLNSAQNNRTFLMTIIKDIRLRERCVIARPTLVSNPVLYICQMRYHHVQARRQWLAATPDLEWMRQYDWAPFEEANEFKPLPQPNHTAVIEDLLKPLPAPDRPMDMGSGNPYGAYARPDLEPADGTPTKPQTGDKGCGFCF